MAELPTDPALRPPDFRTETVEKLGALVDADTMLKGSKWIVGTLLDWLYQGVLLILSAWGFLVAKLIRVIAAGMENADPAFGEIAKAGISALFGVEVSPASLTRLSDRGARDGLKRDVGLAMMNAIAGGAGGGNAGGISPSLEPTERYLGTIADFAIEGWVMGMLAELESFGYLEEFGDLKDTIGQMFGFGRLTRRILGPLIDVSITTPARWQVNKTYRPELLSPSDVIRQMLRGRWTLEQAREELARQGWSEERIDALVNGQQKMFSVGDVRTFVDREHWTRDRGIQHLRDQGYDQDSAEDALRLEGLHRLDQLEGQEAAAIIGAYASRDIDRAEFTSALAAHVSTAPERALLQELGELRLALNVKHLSAPDAAAAVRAQILAVSDYRGALRREGFDEDAVLVKELLLRYELDKAQSIEHHRAAADAERAKEKAERLAAALAKRQQVEADRALARRGRASDLERAVVRGLVPIARYQEVIAASYDADTVDVLTSIVEDERHAYLEQQQKAADAAKRAAVKGISIGELQASVMEHVLTIDDYRGRLKAQHFSDDDVNILTATLAAKLADQEAAQRLRDDAAARAKIKAIDLGRFEALVRKGHRTVQEYDALLASLDYDDASRAAMDELLQVKIADDTAAADARAARDANTPAGELTIAQFRRAVLLGLKSEAQFDSFLTSRRIGADEHALLVAELHEDVVQAVAAQHRRDQAETRSDARELALSTVAQAARLGLITPATYQQRLERAGYSADDVAIELDLLVAEMSDVQSARQQRDQVEPSAIGRGLSLAQVERAVKAGVSTLEQYRSRALELGLSADSVDTLTRVLAAELAATAAAKARRDQLLAGVDASKAPIAVLEQQVVDGTLSLGAYVDQLERRGISPEDAELLAALLGDTLASEGTPA